MKLVLMAVALLPCNSPIAHDHVENVSTVYACPDTAKLFWREIPETPTEVARFKHIQSIREYDLPPFAKAAVGKQAEAPPPKVVKKAKAKPKKKKAKKKRRRG